MIFCPTTTDHVQTDLGVQKKMWAMIKSVQKIGFPDGLDRSSKRSACKISESMGPNQT